ncbi:Uncharacterised protein [Bordetella pertussis]|nr:Uncharacterised protein [Bordetella pertussis]
MAALPPNMSSPGLGSTWWWISLVAFHTRNRPPATRMTSRHENPWPNSSNTGCVSCTMNATVPSSASRRISAMPIPMRRALVWCWGGSLLVSMEMNMRLSMPSTTSMAMRVARAAQAAGCWASETR